MMWFRTFTCSLEINQIYSLKVLSYSVQYFIDSYTLSLKRLLSLESVLSPVLTKSSV